MEQIDAGYEFYVIMVKRSDGKVYSDLSKTNCVIYPRFEDAEVELKKYYNKDSYHIVKMIGYLNDS